MSQKRKFQTYVPRHSQRHGSVHRRWLLIALAAAVGFSGCTKSRTRDQGQVRVWPPASANAASASAKTSIEITDEEPGTENPRGSGNRLAAQPAAASAPANSGDSAQPSETLADKTAPSSSDGRLTDEQRAELERQMSAFEAFNRKRAENATPPVAQMKDDLDKLAADQPKPQPQPGNAPSNNARSMAKANVSLTKGGPAIHRIPLPPERRPDLGEVRLADYAQAGVTSEPQQVREISPVGYDLETHTAQNKSTPETPQTESTKAAAGNEALGPQQPSRFASNRRPQGSPAASQDDDNATGDNKEATAKVAPSQPTNDADAETNENVAAANDASVANDTVANDTAGPPSETAPRDSTPDSTAQSPQAAEVAGQPAASESAATTGDGSEAVADQVNASRHDEKSPPAPQDWRSALYDSIDQLDREIARETDPLEKQRLEASHRILHALVSDREKALRPIPGTAPESQKYWSEQSLALITMLDPYGSPQDSRRARLASRHLKTAQRQLAASSGLDVRNVQFCQQVMGYGWYKEFDPPRFKPDQEIILYAELENFSYGQTADGYETEFQSGYQVYDNTGRRVAEHDFLLVQQVCRNVQTDYFLPYRMHIPKHLKPGKYRLQLTVEDRKGNKFGQSTPIDFEVAN